MVTLFDKETGNKASAEKSAPSDPSTSIKPKVLTPFIEEFIRDWEKTQNVNQTAEGTMRVSEVLGSLARLYERIRNVVEYKGEHVLKRNAIERILKRLLWEHSSHDTKRIAEVLLRELIWARYLQNDTVSKLKIEQISLITNKYLYLISLLNERNVGISPNVLNEWIWGVASTEIEETIDPTNRELYVDLMLSWLKTYFDWVSETVPEAEKNIQLYLSVHRALAKSDEEIMRFHLLVKMYPDWPSVSQEKVKELSHDFYRFYEQIEKYLSFPDKHTLYRVVQKHVAPFEIFKELVRREGVRIRATLQNTEQFEWQIKEICQGKYSQIQQKVNRGTIRSIIYIFITKVFFALLIEIPYELWRFSAIRYIPIGLNIVVPPAMMWMIGLSIKAPGPDNTERIISRLKTVVYANHTISQTAFSLKRVKRSSFLGTVFALFYLILFILVFGGITYLLLKVNFTFLGIFIFFAFLSLVLLFGFRVRFTAQELKVTSEREGLIKHVFDNLTLPFLSAGVYLSKGLAKINFFTVILDFLIEAPLKTIIEVVEEWTSFIREKREEVVEVPEQ